MTITTISIKQRPSKRRLVYIYHNWESGTITPIWDDIFETMESPEYSFERRIRRT
jgi:effector-binding domain-containing protein